MIRKVVNKQWKIIASGFLASVLFILLVVLTDLISLRGQPSLIVYLVVALLLLLCLLSILLFLQSDDEIAFLKAAERYGMAYESLAVKCIINHDGSAFIYRDIKVVATSQFAELDTFLYAPEQTDEGKPWEIDRNIVKVESLTHGWKISAKDFKLNDGRLSALLHIHPPLLSNQSMVYRMEQRLPKGFYSAELDPARFNPDEDHDYWGWTINRPTRHLHLSVHLPPSNVMPQEHQLQVQYASASDFPAQHAQYEERTRANNVELKESKESRGYILELSVDYPVTGLIYILRWLPPLRSSSLSSSTKSTLAERMSSAFPGIHSELLARIHNQLTRCGHFESDQSLRYLFVDNRISDWGTRIPQAHNVQERVDALIGYLINKKDMSGQNGLIIFLYVLSGKSDDNCKLVLTQLAVELEQSLNTNR